MVDTVQKSGNVSYNWMLIPGIYEEGQRIRRTHRVLEIENGGRRIYMKK